MEVFGTIVTYIELGYITALVVVSDTAHQTYISARNVRISARIVILALVIEHQCAYGMITESAIVVQLCLKIPVARLSGIFTVTDGSIFAFFTIKNTAILLNNRKI